MEFEKVLYEDRLNDLGFIKYNSIDVDGDQLVFNLSDKITEDKVRNIEFEFMSAIDLKNGDSKVLPSTIDEILLEKATNNKASVFLGKCSNDGIFDEKLIFEIPKFGFFNSLKTAKGLLFVSDHSLQIEQKRRKKVVIKIDSKTNESANIIMKLSSEDVVDDQLGTTFDPINAEVLKKMFGNPNLQLKETYREAMSIALNTPDIALIQGPPGTGKTTLIKGVITRINKMNKNYKILVSSEQHEALYNVVDKLSENKLIPPFVSSKKFDDDNDDKDNQHFEKNVIEFQKNFSLLCNELLRDVKKKDSKASIITECVYILQDIRDNSYSKKYISTVLDSLKSKIMTLGYYDKMTNEFSELYQCINTISSKEDDDNLDFTTRNIIRKIDAQRTNLEAYFDDGASQLKDLQSILRSNEYNELLINSNDYDVLQSGDKKSIEKVFNNYIEYVEKIKGKLISKESNEFNEKLLDPVAIIKSISRKLSLSAKEKPKDFSEIIEILLYRLNDIDAAGEVVKNYTSVIGSTCAQAERSSDIADLQNDKFDFVIIDEAARANPLDIMIPMMMGTKVILIGDHKQLPHYIETNYVSKFKNKRDRYSNFDENLLTKSLFQIIFENLDKAYKEGRLKFKRTIQIDEQHRMNPVIGTFISNEFYNGSIKNGEKTLNNINDFNVFNKKNLAWLNVNLFDGPEIKIDQSIGREPEAIRITSLIKELVSKNSGRNLDIGIITFYKGQVKLIKQKLEDFFPKSVLENISCNTVDSYQGKEFDIVILSGVRSNMYSTPEKSLGFIHHSPSRINVALSRAKKLLVVVADADTYRKTEHFQHFIDYVKKEGYYGQ
jgi:superfamily I DNA and/or RNA helicase